MCFFTRTLLYFSINRPVTNAVNANSEALCKGPGTLYDLGNITLLLIAATSNLHLYEDRKTLLRIMTTRDGESWLAETRA